MPLKMIVPHNAPQKINMHCQRIPPHFKEEGSWYSNLDCGYISCLLLWRIVSILEIFCGVNLIAVFGSFLFNFKLWHWIGKIHFSLLFCCLLSLLVLISFDIHPFGLQCLQPCKQIGIGHYRYHSDSFGGVWTIYDIIKKCNQCWTGVSWAMETILKAYSSIFCQISFAIYTSYQRLKCFCELTQSGIYYCCNFK